MSFCKGITLATLIGTMSVAGIIAAVPQSNASAQADQYERVLAGIRLNSRANSVLKAFGNPNDVVVGDVGIREAPASAGGAATGGAGVPGAPSGFGGGASGRVSGPPSVGGGRAGAPPSFGGAPSGFGSGSLRGGGAAAGGFPGAPSGFGGGAPSGFGGAPSGFGGGSSPFGGARGADDGDGRSFGGAPSGFGGAGFSGTPTGGNVGQFGQTTSTLTPQQETTWIYNRRAGKDVVSYEFLIGQGGAVTQIRTIGYAGGNVKTRKGVVLGSTYKEVVQKYGYPEQQYRAGRSLLASYKTKNHVLFQFLNQRGQSENPFSAGNKVIAITIASVE